MKSRYLYVLWIAMFILCAGLGFIPEPSGMLQALLTVLSFLFFLPPAMLVRKGKTDRALVRNLSIASLSLSVFFIIANFLAVFRSQFVGDLLHGILVVVSSPMMCCGNWALSLFLWACLLIASLKA